MVPVVTSSAGANRRAFYRPELDLLRFLAFFLVFVHHAMPAAYVRLYPFLQKVTDACEGGLQLFFLLSAYLIAELLLREREETGSVHLGAFYIRRILRIWPLYFLIISVGVAFGRWTHFTPKEFLGFALLGGNWIIYSSGFPITPLGPLWSISIEEQFYLIWPILCRFGGRRILFFSSVIFILLANLTLYILGIRDSELYKVWSHTLVEFQFLAAGTLLALWLHKRPAFSAPVFLRLLLIVAGAGLGLAVLPFLKQGAGLSLIVAFAILTLSVLCIFLAFYGMSVPRSYSPLLYLGKISYGLYVFHYFGIIAANHLTARFHLVFPLAHPAIALIFATALAALSYRYVETPFLKLKRRFTFIPTRRQPPLLAEVQILQS